jgi:hypothetical protein
MRAPPRLEIFYKEIGRSGAESFGGARRLRRPRDGNDVKQFASRCVRRMHDDPKLGNPIPGLAGGSANPKIPARSDLPLS